MTFRQGLLRARGHIVFLLGLLAAFALIITLERWEPAPRTTAIPEAEEIPAPVPAPLGVTERAAAQAAWSYFESNIRPETGLADSVAGFPATTLWDSGSMLLGTVAAERLGVLSRDRFDQVVGAALKSLAALPLYDGRLPNKSYNTITLAMTDYVGEPSEEGIGWSALDLGRILIAFHALLRHYPEHAPAVNETLDSWDIGAAVAEGIMVGALPTEDGYTLVQEGRVGYEQYAAKGFALMGYDVSEAQTLSTFLDWVEVSDVEVPTDSRTPEEFGGHSYTLSEPYVLDGLEFGWDVRSRVLAWHVYLAQAARHEQTGLLTAVTEDHLDREPFFVYSTVYANGEPWAVLTDVGEAASGLRTLSTKAAIGWHALYRTAYTQQLYAAIEPLATKAGWWAGLYEDPAAPNEALSSNTNGIILEALHYWARGPLLHPRKIDPNTAARTEK